MSFETQHTVKDVLAELRKAGNVYATVRYTDDDMIDLKLIKSDVIEQMEYNRREQGDDFIVNAQFLPSGIYLG